MIIDLNCDMGEGIGNDAAIMPFISSANIACGYHSGNEDTMKETIELAIQHDVHVGAHPSFSDRENFGRQKMNLSLQEIHDLILVQIELLNKIAQSSGTTLHHVKPHGALYNQSAEDPSIAKTIAAAIKEFDSKLILFGLSGSNSIYEAKKIGLKTASEVFADRTYQNDGTLTNRSQPNALIENANQAVSQALQMIKKRTVTTINGKTIPIDAETICIHGDGKHAIAFSKSIHNAIIKEEIKIQPVN